MEMIDVYNSDGDKTGKVIPRNSDFSLLDSDDRLLVVHACVFNSEGHMLLQKRRETKDRYPNCWDVSAGGFAMSGESSQEAVKRELREEIGMYLPNERIFYVCREPFSIVFDDFYAVYSDVSLDELKLQYEEVSEAAWFSMGEVLDMLNEGILVDYPEELIKRMFSVAECQNMILEDNSKSAKETVNNNTVRILGIDPGIATIGFGLIDFNREKNSYKYLKCGIISTPAHTPLSERLCTIYDDMTRLITAFKPDVISIEELFFNTNITTGISVAHGRGVILLACKKAALDIYEYTPLQVKQSVVGYGRAQKKQVMDMVKRLCALKETPKPDDAADALALALCHARSSTSLLYKGENAECSTI